jgi:DNA polymerase I-like protein with 3'-5' exonuclease and polymerase domains
MHNAGMIRRECYITNVFKVQVQKKGNDLYIGGELVYRAGSRGGFTEEATPWLTHLKDELDSLEQPTVIVPMGEAAIRALCEQVSPTKVRGSIYPCPWEGARRNCKVIPCIHPSAALRKYIWRYYIIFDLRRAKTESEFPELRRKVRHFIHRPSAVEVVAYFKTITKEKRPQAVDIEVYNQEISVFGCGQDDEGIVVPFMHGHEHFYSLEDEIQIWLAIAEYMEDPNILKVLQNGTFDLWVLARNNNIFAKGPIFDTMVAMKQLYPDFEKGLNTIASLFTSEPYYKDELKMWNTRMLNQLGGSIDDRMATLWNYNEKDVAVTWEAHLKLKHELKHRGMLDTFNMTMATFPTMIYMETRGIRVNREALQQVKLEIEAKIIALQAELDQLVGFSLNINSAPQLKNYFYSIKGVKPYYNRKTGKPTCDDDALKRLSRSTTQRKGFREAAIIREMRGLSKLLGTYLNVELDSDSRIRCSINPSGTKNGRWSTGQTLFGTGTNLQNLPQQFKRFLEADPGTLLFEIDKAQGEWVICAYVSGDSNMIQVVDSGEDAHVGTAHRAFHVPKELIVAENKVAGHETDPIALRKLREENVPEILAYSIPGSMTCRQAGKKGNHGLNYDLGYRSFGFINEIPENEARQIVEAYHQAYPMIREGLHRWVRDQLGKTRTLVNVFGRKRTFYDRWGDSLFKDGYAFPAQSALVDLVNRALVKIFSAQDSYWMRWVDLMMQVHDSIFGQYWLHNYDYRAMARAVIQIGAYMNPTMTWQGREFNIRSDVKVGLNWAGFHPTHNPVGMMELEWTEDVEALAEQLWATHTELIANSQNI